MKPIVFDAQCENETKRVEIYQPYGAGNVLYITIGGYHHGQAVFQQGDAECI